jgi:hypothetical protein
VRSSSWRKWTRPPSSPATIFPLFDVAGGQGGGCHDEDQKLDGVDGVRALLPPAHAAFKVKAILPDRDIRRFTLEPFAEFGGFRLAVRAGVRQENAYLFVRLLGT